MEWHKVRLNGEDVLAYDSLGGVFVRFHETEFTRVYVPGYRIKLMSGDADHNVLVKREQPRQRLGLVIEDLE